MPAPKMPLLIRALVFAWAALVFAWNSPVPIVDTLLPEPTNNNNTNGHHPPFRRLLGAYRLYVRPWHTPIIGSIQFLAAHWPSLRSASRVDLNLSLGLLEKALYLAGVHASLLMLLCVLARPDPITLWIVAGHLAAQYMWDMRQSVRTMGDDGTLAPTYLSAALAVHALGVVPLLAYMHGLRLPYADTWQAHLLGWMLADLGSDGFFLCTLDEA